MFSRVHYDNWQTVIPLIAFILTFTVFLYFSIRALCMQRTQIESMSHLPLENDETPNPRKS
jgi:hypothetical protein